MSYPCSGAILSGGLNTRMGGRNKAFLVVGNQRILDRLGNTFQSLFEEVLLVTNDPLHYLSWDMMMVSDLFPIRSSLTGIHAALFHCSQPHVLVTACDTPFLKRELIRVLLNELEPKWDVVMPVTEEGHQPLCAIYSKRCLKPIVHQLEHGDPKIVNFFSKVKVKEVPEEKLRAADPDLTSFFNINTPEDLAASEKMLMEGRGIATTSDSV
ncbi:MAG: molybdenum cofactor guanylyltransferase [Thermodesulfobacteriota bacterium]|nr:molybdenum cofactor guanylyltransferase [Thermodesulfobacteriota bacterium]